MPDGAAEGRSVRRRPYIVAIDGYEPNPRLPRFMEAHCPKAAAWTVGEKMIPVGRVSAVVKVTTLVSGKPLDDPMGKVTKYVVSVERVVDRVFEVKD